MREWSVEALVTRFLKYSACWKVLYRCLYSAKQSVKFQPVALKLRSSVFSKPKIDSPKVAAPKQPKFKRQNSYHAEATLLYFQWKNSSGTVNPKVAAVTNSPSSKTYLNSEFLGAFANTGVKGPAGGLAPFVPRARTLSAEGTNF